MILFLKIVLDKNIYKYKTGSIAFDLWQVKSGTIFDDIIVTDSVEEAQKFAKETFLKKQEPEKEAKKKLDDEEAKKLEEENKKREAEENKKREAEEKAEKEKEGSEKKKEEKDDGEKEEKKEDKEAKKEQEDDHDEL